jgi:CelD/BcsL family acetyltransferase involved in cellulose biosynthesis
MLLDDEVLAAHWGYVFAGRFYHLMPAYAGGKWGAFAPGRLLNEWLIEWSLERDLKIFDFCIGDEPYKFGYCDTHVPLHDAVLPVTLKGQLYAATWRMKEAARNTLRETALGAALKSARKRWRGAVADSPSSD